MDDNNIDYKLEELFAEWRARMKQNVGHDNPFTKDGILYKHNLTKEETLERWESAQKRVLFLLKDQNQKGELKWNEDIREWLNYENNRNLDSPFIKMLAYFLWGLCKIEDGADWWYDEVTQHIEEVKDFFNTQPFALVECKKLPGGGVLDNKVLKEHLKHYGDLLKREIEILRPNMIVCTSNLIFGFLIQTYPNGELKGNGSVYYHSDTSTFIFSSYHPSVRRMAKEDIYEGIMFHYRNFLKGHY